MPRSVVRNTHDTEIDCKNISGLVDCIDFIYV